MIVKIPKVDYSVDWKVFFAEWNIQFLTLTETEDSYYLKIVEDPSPADRTAIEAAIVALGNKIYWSDDPKADTIFDESVK